MSLTTVSAIKAHLGIASNDLSQDERLERFRLGVEAVILNKLGRDDLATTTYTEYYAGNGLLQLVLRNRPVQSITSIYEDEAALYGYASGAFPSTTLLVAGTDYVLQRDGGPLDIGRSGIVIRIGTTWPAASVEIESLLTRGVTEAVGNLKVVYVAGYATIPADIALTVHQLVAELLNSARSGGAMQSETLDYYTYIKANATQLMASLVSVKSLLAPYVEVVI